jgi:hypothetical protein
MNTPYYALLVAAATHRPHTLDAAGAPCVAVLVIRPTATARARFRVIPIDASKARRLRLDPALHHIHCVRGVGVALAIVVAWIAVDRQVQATVAIQRWWRIKSHRRQSSLLQIRSRCRMRLLAVLLFSCSVWQFRHVLLILQPHLNWDHLK